MTTPDTNTERKSKETPMTRGEVVVNSVMGFLFVLFLFALAIDLLAPWMASLHP